MRQHIAALAALLLSAVATAAEVPAGSGGTAREACPVTVEATYTRVGRLDFGAPDPKLDFTGWQPRFSPSTLRLIGANINFGADDKREITNNMPDNGDEAKPGDPEIFTLWQKGAKKPSSPAYLMCQYEGGLAVQKPLPLTARVCTLRTNSQKAAAFETTTRTFITKAEVSCK